MTEDAIDKKRGVVRKLQTSSVYGRFSQTLKSQFITWRFAPPQTSNAGIMNEFNGAVFELRTATGQVIDVMGDHAERKTGNITLEVHNTEKLSHTPAYLSSREAAELVKSLLGALIGSAATITGKDWNEIAGRLERVRLEWEENDSEHALRTKEWSEMMYKLGEAVDKLVFIEDAREFVEMAKDALHEMGQNYHGLLMSFFKPKSLADAERVFRGGRFEPAPTGEVARDVQSSYPHRDFSTIVTELPVGYRTKADIDAGLATPEQRALADIAQIAFTEAGDMAQALERIRARLQKAGE